MTKKIRSTQPPEVLSLAAFIAENSKLKCHTLHLGSDKLSDRLNLSGISKGLILINGGSTGTGKTYMMTEAAFLNKGYVFAATKAVNMQQSHDAKTKKRKRVVNDKIEEYSINPRFTQVEKIKALYESWDRGETEINEIHFDEAQLIYEGGYRERVEDMVEYLSKFAKKIPVFFYSATFIPALSPVEFDFTLNLTNNFRRDLSLFQLKSEDEYKVELLIAEAKKAGKEIKVDIPKGVLLKKANEIIDILVYVKNTHKKKIVFFMNDTELMDAIKEELAKRDISAEVVSSQRLITGKAPWAKKIMEKSKFDKSIKIDILLATNTLEAGINIENNISIGSIQTAPQKVFQQLGRARGKGFFFLVAGTGSGIVVPQVIERDSREVSILLKKCKFNNAHHAACCDGFTTYMSRSELSRNAGFVVSGLQELGYHVAEIFDGIIATNKKSARGTLKKYASYINEKIPKDKIENIKEYLGSIAKGLKISIVQAEKYAEDYAMVSRAIRAMDINITPDDFIQRINKGNLEYICSLIIRNEARKRTIIKEGKLSPDELKDEKFFNEFCAEIERIKQLKKEIPASVLENISNGFWTKIFLKDGDNPDEIHKRLPNLYKLFRFLIGFEVNAHGEYVVTKDAGWWKVVIPKEHKSGISKVHTAVKTVMTVEDFCNHEQLNQVEIGLKYTPGKAKKKALTYIDEIKF